MSEVKHTPLPWRVEEGHIQRDSNGIRYWQITDGQDAIACNQFCYAGYDPDVNAANARLIVQAVNSHGDLVEALRRAKRDIVALRHAVTPPDAMCCEEVSYIDTALSKVLELGEGL